MEENFDYKLFEKNYEQFNDSEIQVRNKQNGRIFTLIRFEYENKA